MWISRHAWAYYTTQSTHTHIHSKPYAMPTVQQRCGHKHHFKPYRKQILIRCCLYDVPIMWLEWERQAWLRITRVITSTLARSTCPWRFLRFFIVAQLASIQSTTSWIGSCRIYWTKMEKPFSFQFNTVFSLDLMNNDGGTWLHFSKTSSWKTSSNRMINYGQRIDWLERSTMA